MNGGGGLAKESILGRQDHAFGQAKTRFVERSVGVEHFVPVMVFAKLIAGGFGQIHRHALAGAKDLIEFEVDLRDDIVGIDF